MQEDQVGGQEEEEQVSAATVPSDASAGGNSPLRAESASPASDHAEPIGMDLTAQCFLYCLAGRVRANGCCWRR